MHYALIALTEYRDQLITAVSCLRKVFRSLVIAECEKKIQVRTGLHNTNRKPQRKPQKHTTIPSKHYRAPSHHDYMLAIARHLFFNTNALLF
ncbi:hypothetical protein AOXY_G18980 [Acipenser oxyrinchus oxyrinchus]|uniref:Uncharacterized protein n=1 Tax=Acipenser oxyrinchus oxyrinchus TaxID=40147 RepID=A0AAD8FY16_ACIOX|nr:hypothetical protein AOXY_G18980 [Acipenser oxyrinchus oxyrinchus]